MKLDIEVKLNLDFLGDGWENCYLSFTPVSIGSARKMADVTSKSEKEQFDAGIELLSSNLLGGRVLSNGKEVEFKKENIEDLPVSIISEAVNLLVGDISKKK